ncbi:MAG: hypothetical protein GWP06_02110 [Actinobacteria bacterium]|nr:hypothetical protein [Actinomycetota bacterium]
MKFYLFAPPESAKRPEFHKDKIEATLQKVADGTDTSDLVVALYLTHNSRWTGGTAYVRSWLTPAHFKPVRGKWRVFSRFFTPRDLPRHFKLIRMHLRGNTALYPIQEQDQYKWKHRYFSFNDHLAHLFAHELHHYRRFHLGFHPGEGENGANKWALKRVTTLGFKVQSEKLPTKKKKQKKKTINFSAVLNPMDFVRTGGLKGQINWENVFTGIALNTNRRQKKKYIEKKLHHFEKLRALAPGTKLMVSYDPSQKYTEQFVTIVRTMRRNSVRIVVRTDDGREWRWPMAWLSQDGVG